MSADARFEGASKPDREVTVGTLDGAPLRATFPLRATVFGVDAVVIPAAEYAALVASDGAEQVGARFAVVRSALRTARVAPGRARSTVERDPEVAEFLRGRFAVADTIEQARAACEARFGLARTPSPGRIGRYRRRLP